MIALMNSCAVIKTPYFKTDYYQKTVSRLDSIKSTTKTINDSLFAGFSRISITPDLNNYQNPEYSDLNKVPLAGFGNRKGKPSIGVHDTVFVKAVALRTGYKTLVLVSADLLIMPPNIIDSVTNILARKGVSRDQLFFSATHTHSSLGGWGPGLIAKIFSGKENPEIEKWLISRIDNAVLGAISDLKPASIGSGSFDASQYTRNRLTGNEESINNDFSFLIIEQTGMKKAIIGSFSAHATTLGRTNMLISGDYPGYWQRKLEDNSVDVAIFSAGSTGSQSAVGQGDKFENAKYIGESLADSLLVHMKDVSMHDRITFSTMSLKIHLPEYHIRLTTNRNITTGLSKRLMPIPENVYFQALRINNLIWISTPGDFSGESALQIKKSLSCKGYESIVTGFNGSYIGYIMPGKYFYLDHYESKTMGWFGPTMGDYSMELIERMNEIFPEP